MAGCSGGGNSPPCCCCQDPPLAQGVFKLGLCSRSELGDFLLFVLAPAPLLALQQHDGCWARLLSSLPCCSSSRQAPGIPNIPLALCQGPILSRASFCRELADLAGGLGVRHPARGGTEPWCSLTSSTSFLGQAGAPARAGHSSMPPVTEVCALVPFPGLVKIPSALPRA